MRSFLPVSALLCLTVATPTPQAIDYAAVIAAPDPILVAAPLDVESNKPPKIAPAPIKPITSDLPKNSRTKRDACSPQPVGSGPIPTPDTADAFTSDPGFSSMANNAPVPDGYAKVFANKKASLSASNYMGLYTLDSYDSLTCASKCDQAAGCSAFNLYIERDPSVDPGSACPNPTSTTNYKCTLWGAPVVAEEATNQGGYRNDFHIVIAGSNAYNKDAPPPAISGFSGPTELGGSINAPSGYMGYQFFPFSQSQGYDPSTCASACTQQTTYNSKHPGSDGSFQTCVFFNAYVISQNAIPQGLYCTLYSQAWDRSFATNYGQTRGSDRFSVSRSYSYTLA